MIFYETRRSTEKNYFYCNNNTNISYKAHAHYSFELIWVQEGKILCTIDSQSYLLCQNDIIIILPEQIHSYETPNYSKSYLCIFSNDMVSDFYKVVQDKKFDSPVFHIDCIKEIIEELNSSRNIFTQKALLYLLCALPYEQNKLLPAKGTNRNLTGLIVRYIENNYFKDISLKQLAKECGYNYTYLSAFFNENFKQSFSAYINRLRLQQAAHLLGTTNKSITEIAYDCGFSTIRNFNTAFKKHYHVSPRNFRSQ